MKPILRKGYQCIEQSNHPSAVKPSLKEELSPITKALVKLVIYYFTMIIVQLLLVLEDLVFKVINHTETLLKTRIVQGIQ